ncbi:hypothetical protein C9J12_29340 [Photobacterium frigidiphilum]|uniref:Uncharacterized protein n=1 Tax=Photobacterium frigidiphilum TaxID=264736 RepID=A0A2T3J5V7_9GAMM|nr:hypothetical protein C9J12_29340 [Photobacterium frigidiphilum]
MIELLISRSFKEINIIKYLTVLSHCLAAIRSVFIIIASAFFMLTTVFVQKVYLAFSNGTVDTSQTLSELQPHFDSFWCASLSFTIKILLIYTALWLTIVLIKMIKKDSLKK